jgi:hypothetical protein
LKDFGAALIPGGVVSNAAQLNRCPGSVRAISATVDDSSAPDKPAVAVQHPIEARLIAL